jgi:1-acyl-sn-glycerol-3-phosphate acyltransferase
MGTEISIDERKEISEAFLSKKEKPKLKEALKEVSKILQEAVGEIESLSQEKDLSFSDASGIILKHLNRIGPILSGLYMNSIGKLIRAYQMLVYSDAVDEFGYDPKFEDFVKPIFKFLYEKWWRVEVEGGENIPHKGRVLFVANHSGTLPWDGAMIKYYVREIHPSHRDIRPLAENFVYYLPFAGTIMNRVGGVRACQENAEILLMRDEAVIVFPEGVKGIVKHFSLRYKLQRFGRGGFVKLAIRTRSPILPVAVVGAEEIYPVIAKFDSLGKIFNLPTVPIVLNMILLGPFGFIPFPSKWYIKFGKIIDVSEYPPEAAEDDILVNQISQEVRARIEDMIAELLAKRKSIWR